MIEPQYLEDYVRVLLHLVNAKLNPLKLSHADLIFVHGINKNINRGLTHNQMDLIRKLVLKYARQLRRFNLDTSAVSDMGCRIQIRDNLTGPEPYIDFDGKMFLFRLNWVQKNKEITEKIRTSRQGTFDTVRGRAYPSLANIEILKTMIDSYPQHITDSARAVFDQAQRFNTRYQDYNMKLQPDGSISNCTAELRKHLNKKLRKLSLEQKLLWLYDRAFEYGYLVSDVHAQVEALANITFVNWYSAAMFYFDIKIHSVDSIFNYAQAVGRKYIILHPTYNINYTIPQTLKPHLHVITADSKPRLSLQDLDVNKINVCYFKSSSSVQLITVSLRLKKLLEQEGLESETLLLSNATVPNTKMKVLIIK